MRKKLSEETVKRLPIPVTGNRVITYFAGAVIQGAKAPRSFGVHVTAAGASLALSGILNFTRPILHTDTKASIGVSSVP